MPGEIRVTAGPRLSIVSTMHEPLDKTEPATRARIAAAFNGGIPHNQAIGLEVVDVSGDWVHTRLAYREAFLGDPVARLWHTSVGTTAADSSCGLAVFLALPTLEAIATLDLRMDYLRPAVAGKPLQVRASCHHITRYVAFVRAMLYQNDIDRPTAHCTAVFMRTGRQMLP